MSSALNEMERKILDFMVQYLRENTYQPSIREIGERFGIKSTKTVSEHLQALASKGHLERDPSRSRGVRILGVDLHPQTVSLPCYEALPRDRAQLRTDRAETFLTLDRRLAGEKGGFFVRAGGVDLPALGVTEGDYVLVQPATASELEDGAIVVARIEDGPAYYHYSENGTGVALKPLRSGGETTLLEDPSTLNVVGRVAAVFRRMDGHAVQVNVTAH